MFQSVEYLGFDGQPALRAKAEQLTPVLADQVRRWRDRVGVTWSPDPADPRGSLNLTLSLILPVGVGGQALGTFSPADLAEPWRVRSRCRSVWSDLLGDLSQQLMGRIEASLAEPVEV